MAVRDLRKVQVEAEMVTREEQLQLVVYLLSKTHNLQAAIEALLSESTLAKDWLRPEEDEAWANL